MRRLTSDISSASETTPDRSVSFSVPLGSPQPTISQSTLLPKEEKGDIPVSCEVLYSCATCMHASMCYFSLVQEYLRGIDQLKLASAKLQSTASNAALKLMDCVFTTDEMVNGNPSGQTNSKDPVRKRTICALDTRKMKFISGAFQNYLSSDYDNFLLFF